MAVPVLNGVQKPADVIAKGPHIFDEATRKYKEIPQTFSEFPRAMWHQTLGYKEAQSREQKLHMESEGWSLTPFPAKVAKELIMAQSGDLAMIVLQQQATMQQQAELLQQMQEKLQSLSQPTTAPAVPIVVPPLKREPKA
jgi:hypothetical protein